MHDVWQSLRAGFFMFWETLWPLVLGFGLSGAVQAFVPRDRLERVLGDHRPASVARAAGFGMASSSCSYAATAMGKSLFANGADFVTAMIFMFASTNLVVELGVVLVILLGWQFLAAELIGGPLMIVLLALTGGWVVSSATAAAARARVREGQATAPGTGADGSDRATWRTAGGWADAASYALADLTMLRRELVIGYAVAGFLAVLVPTHAWNDVFLHGHGWLTSIENVIVGPLVAILSFVCSVGNVPLAAALWKGGISFGGVVSFVFADLITLPLLLIYRKYYGTAMAVRMLAWFWAVMAVSGLAVEALARATGLVPHDRAVAHIADPHFAWNATAALNTVALLLVAGMLWLRSNRDRWGGGEGYAIDPVCGMQVRTASAPATAVAGGRRVWFCSDRCRDRFAARAGD